MLHLQYILISGLPESVKVRQIKVSQAQDRQKKFARIKVRYDWSSPKLKLAKIKIIKVSHVPPNFHN